MGKSKRKRTNLELADELYRQIIRSKGFCERCGKRENLQTAHIISRSYHQVRHDLDNSFCLCDGCHRYFTNRPIEFETFVKSKIGEAHYQELKDRAIDYKKIDYKAVIKRLQESQQI